MKTIPAIFFDRDGTLIVDYGYTYKISDLNFIHGTIKTLQKLSKMGYIFIIVTNQSGIARGMFTESEFIKLTKFINFYLYKYDIIIHATYYCPHHINGKINAFKKKCFCRKPNPGMFISAQNDLDIDLKKSYMIGDKLEDMQAANAAGIGTKILLNTQSNVTIKSATLANWIIPSINDITNVINLAK